MKGSPLAQALGGGVPLPPDEWTLTSITSWFRCWLRAARGSMAFARTCRRSGGQWLGMPINYASLKGRCEWHIITFSLGFLLCKMRGASSVIRGVASTSVTMGLSIWFHIFLFNSSHFEFFFSFFFFLVVTKETRMKNLKEGNISNKPKKWVLFFPLFSLIQLLV